MTATLAPAAMVPTVVVDWLTPAECRVPTLTLDDSLFTAIEWFEADVDLRLIPVVDAARRPIGAIFEKDVRRILLSPFGHALLSNPCFGHAIDRHLRSCPVADTALSVGELIGCYEAAGGSEGMILTRNGRLFAAISNRRLIKLAVAHEAARAERRIERARRIEEASRAFEADVATLLGTLAELANDVDANAGAMADRSREAGSRAATVASAAAQTGQHMTTIADRGRELATTLADMARETRSARASASDAIALVGEGSRRTHELLQTAQSIDHVVATIGDMAHQVNLLALNATIEAARAGEAGRGFTVVANAIKGLAMQARGATEMVAHEIGLVRNAIGEVVANAAEVEAAIGAIGAHSTAIEAAAEHQAQATRQVAGHVGEVVEASRAITGDTAAIAGTAAQATRSSEDARILAAKLLAGAGRLSRQVDGFLADIRAA